MALIAFVWVDAAKQPPRLVGEMLCMTTKTWLYDCAWASFYH
jgi:hypothetical protein